MKYSDDCKVYRIRYYNVWFYLFAKTEMDEYKINILGERIGMGDSMMMKDIHCWLWQSQPVQRGSGCISE